MVHRHATEPILLNRFLVIAAIVVGLALAAPHFAPTLFGALMEGGLRFTAVGPAGPPSPVDAPPEAMAPSPEAFEPEPPPESVPMIRSAVAGRAVIPADASGHYVADARINGRAVVAMIDTGASAVALGDATARRLGIFPLRSAYTRPVATANGTVSAAPVMLSEIRIGAVAVRNVEALVLPPEALDVDLLGMSFLGRLRKFEASADGMLLFQ
jgi:aspartyl protease family protein